MLQLYFLSVAANFLAGATLSADWMAERFTSLAGILDALSGRRARTSRAGRAPRRHRHPVRPGGPPLVLGDLFPSVVGIAVGIALLFEVFKQDALYAGEQAARGERGAEDAKRVPHCAGRPCVCRRGTAFLSAREAVLLTRSAASSAALFNPRIVAGNYSFLFRLGRLRRLDHVFGDSGPRWGCSGRTPARMSPCSR